VQALEFTQSEKSFKKHTRKFSAKSLKKALKSQLSTKKALS
jgi:hypothetical protein